MVRPINTRRFALSFALVLALLVGGFSYQAAASTATVNLFGDRSAYCASIAADAPAVYQGGTFRLKFERFWTEYVEIDVTFPDGRIFTVPAARFLLDGVIDQPINDPATTRFPTNNAGELAGLITVPGEWPYGCYEFSARGLSSGKTTRAYLVVTPGGGPTASGPATFSVTRTGSNDAQGNQGAYVDLNGSGFLGEEMISLWLTAPDGTVVDFPTADQFGNPLPPVRADNSGDFQTAFQFDGKNPTGTYQFTALGTISGFRVITSFTLDSQPVSQRGVAQFRVAFPPDRGTLQRGAFEVQGELFNPYERVDIWVTLPDGAVRGLPSQFADQVGDFYAVLYLDERLPVGFYQVTAKGAESNQLMIASLTLEPTDGTRYNPDPGPEVVLSSADQLGSPPEALAIDEYGNPGARVP